MALIEGLSNIMSGKVTIKDSVKGAKSKTVNQIFSDALDKDKAASKKTKVKRVSDSLDWEAITIQFTEEMSDKVLPEHREEVVEWFKNYMAGQ